MPAYMKWQECIKMVHALGEEIRKGFGGTMSLHVNARVGTEPGE